MRFQRSGSLIAKTSGIFLAILLSLTNAQAALIGPVYCENHAGCYPNRGVLDPWNLIKGSFLRWSIYGCHCVNNICMIEAVLKTGSVGIFSCLMGLRSEQENEIQDAQPTTATPPISIPPVTVRPTPPQKPTSKRPKSPFSGRFRKPGTYAEDLLTVPERARGEKNVSRNHSFDEPPKKTSKSQEFLSQLDKSDNRQAIASKIKAATASSKRKNSKVPSPISAFGVRESRTPGSSSFHERNAEVAIQFRLPKAVEPQMSTEPPDPRSLQSLSSPNDANEKISTNHAASNRSQAVELPWTETSYPSVDPTSGLALAQNWNDRRDHRIVEITAAADGKSSIDSFGSQRPVARDDAAGKSYFNFWQSEFNRRGIPFRLYQEQQRRQRLRQKQKLRVRRLNEMALENGV